MSGGVRGHGMDHTNRFPRTLAGFGLTWHGGSRFSWFLEILESHFITKYLQIGFGSGAHDIFREWHTRFFLVWRTRYFLGVAHTIFFGCGAHDIFGSGAHDIFRCGAHDIFWLWRTHFFVGIRPPWKIHGKSIHEKSMENPKRKISCAPHPKNIVCATPKNTVCATPKKYRVRHSQKYNVSEVLVRSDVAKKRGMSPGIMSHPSHLPESQIN